MNNRTKIRRLTHGIRFAPSGLGLHKPPVGRALGAGTPFGPVPVKWTGGKTPPAVFWRSNIPRGSF
jgi:hypothetical protein